MYSFKVSNFTIGKPLNTFIIAEIGINHEGSFPQCVKMIKLAAKSGANAVKIQTVDQQDSYQKETKSFKEFKNKNFSDLQIKKLMSISKKLKVIFFSTPGDVKSLKRLIQLKVPMLKISSGLSNNFPLIREILKNRTPLIISTGMSDLSNLRELKNFLNKFKFKKISILKCVSRYPTPYNEIDMENITQYKKIFRYPIGYSDHSLGILTTSIAVAKGAQLIEKHFTLNKKLKGADHKISLEPHEFSQMVKNIRYTEKILGSSKIKLSKYIKKNKKNFLRVVAAKKIIKKGEKFNLENIKFIRPINKKGKSPKFFFQIENKKSKKNIRINQIL